MIQDLYIQYKQVYKRNRGVTLIELVVVMAIMSILSAVAGVSYSKYLGNTRKLVLQTDLTNLHQGYQSFTYLSESFCKNHVYTDTNNVCDYVSNMINVGMDSLLLNGIYGAEGKTPNFIGFASVNSSANAPCEIGSLGEDGNRFVTRPPAVTSADCAGAMGRRLVIGLGANQGGGNFTRDTACVLEQKTYKMGVFGFYKKKTWIGMNINHKGFIHVRKDINTSNVRPTAVHTQYIAGDGTKNAPCAALPPSIP